MGGIRRRGTAIIGVLGRERVVRRVGVAATVGMFLVILMGATVTNTGSAEGCGRSWPLCHGQLTPSLAKGPVIEFSHRLVTGIESYLVFALAVGVWLRRRSRREALILIATMLLGLFLQAAMGAWAVLYPQQSAVLALHFGISLVAFAGVFLATRVVWEGPADAALRARPVPAAYRWAAWGALAAALGVSYLGAYMRHSGNELACPAWPACHTNGQIVPGLTGPDGIAFGHRLAAVLATLLVAGLLAWSARFRAARPDLVRINAVALGLIVAQGLAGGWVVLSRLHLFSTLAHAGLIALLFVVLCEGCRRLPARRVRPEAAEARRGAPAPAPAG